MDDVTEVVEQVKSLEDDSELKKAIEDWYEKTHTQGLKTGAKMICSVVANLINKHLNKESKVTLRDYKRLVAEISKFIEVPLKDENKTEEN